MVNPSSKLQKEAFSVSGAGAGSAVGGALGSRYGSVGRAVGSSLGAAAGKRAEEKAKDTDFSKIKRPNFSDDNEPPDSPEPPDSQESSDDDSDDKGSSFLGRFKPSFSFSNPLKFMKLNFLKKYLENFFIKIFGKNYKMKLIIIAIIIVLCIIIYISMEIKKMGEFLDEDDYDY
jgi:hypothetical protein